MTVSRSRTQQPTRGYTNCCLVVHGKTVLELATGTGPIAKNKEKSIDASNAKFAWRIKNGKALAELLPGFRFTEKHSLTEGMAEFVPIYKLLDRLPIFPIKSSS